MKKYLFIPLTLFSLSALASTPELEFASKKDVEKVGNEFGVNFAHSAVAAPETEGLWGVEVGLVGGATKSPKLSDVIDDNGGDGEDFKKIYTGGLMLRGHFPLDLYAEITFLPQRDISDVNVQNKTLGLGWNAGAFFDLPLDVAIGIDFSRAEASYKQTATPIGGGIDVNSKIDLKTRSRVIYLGVSKKFFFFTPYLKIGAARTEADIDVGSNATIFNYSQSSKEKVSTSGGFAALGVNFQVLFFKLGAEVSKMNNVGRAMGKFSLDF